MNRMETDTDREATGINPAYICLTCKKKHHKVLFDYMEDTPVTYEFYSVLAAASMLVDNKSTDLNKYNRYEFCSIKCLNVWSEANKEKVLIEMARL